MIKRQVFLYFAYLFILLGGCKKEQEIDWAGVYSPSDVIQVDLPRMYIKGGIIDDLKFIKDFLNRGTFSGLIDTGFIFNQSTQINQRNILIDIPVNDTAYVEHFGLFFPSLVKYIPYERSSNELILRPIDSTITHMSSQYERKYIDLMYFMDKYNTDHVDYFGLNPVSGYPSYMIGRAKYNMTLIHSNGKILMPLVKSHLRSGSGLFFTSDLWIHFNPDIISHLQWGDTLVIQTKTLQMIKQ